MKKKKDKTISDSFDRQVFSEWQNDPWHYQKELAEIRGSNSWTKFLSGFGVGCSLATIIFRIFILLKT